MKTKTFHFLRHYVEMVVAMMLGMLVLGGAADVALGAGSWHDDAPALMLLSMAFTMTVPMVAWMRYRGHGWGASWEMTASMFVPSLAAVALLWAGAVTDPGTLMAIQHAVMFPAMLAVMFLRLDEYTGHHALV
jgi:flagellar biosynthetic protein FliP